MSPPSSSASNALSEGSDAASFSPPPLFAERASFPFSPSSPKPFSSPLRQLEVNWAGAGGWYGGDRLPLSAHSLHLSRPCALASHVLRPGRINQVVGARLPRPLSALCLFALPLHLTPPPSFCFFSPRLRLPLGSRPTGLFLYSGSALAPALRLSISGREELEGGLGFFSSF